MFSLITVLINNTLSYKFLLECDSVAATLEITVSESHTIQLFALFPNPYPFCDGKSEDWKGVGNMGMAPPSLPVNLRYKKHLWFYQNLQASNGYEQLVGFRPGHCFQAQTCG